jgi:hypothetical protein
MPFSKIFDNNDDFLGGCGRFFEGTADQMYTALIKTIGSLPGNTQMYRLYCASPFKVTDCVMM